MEAESLGELHFLLAATRGAVPAAYIAFDTRFDTDGWVAGRRVLKDEKQKPKRIRIDVEDAM